MPMKRAFQNKSQRIWRNLELADLNSRSSLECFFAIANSWQRRFFREDVQDEQDKNRCMCVFEALFATGLSDFIL